MQKTICTGVEMFRKLLDQGQAGDNVGVLLRGTKREDVERGQVLCKPGSITPHTKFLAEAYILTKEEGGRHTPFFTNYRPQFYFRTTDVTGIIKLKEGVEMIMPGDNVELDVELITPIAMDQGLRFAIREGGRHAGRQRRTEHRADHPDRHGPGPALRDPRRRPHGRLGRRLEDHRVRRAQALSPATLTRKGKAAGLAPAAFPASAVIPDSAGADLRRRCPWGRDRERARGGESALRIALVAFRMVRLLRLGIRLARGRIGLGLGRAAGFFGALGLLRHARRPAGLLVLVAVETLVGCRVAAWDSSLRRSGSKGTGGHGASIRLARQRRPC